jgi:hypothetical protein
MRISQKGRLCHVKGILPKIKISGAQFKLCCTAAYSSQSHYPQATAGLAMFRGGGKLQNARSLHLCATAGSLLNLVLAVHVMRSRCNHNIASILRANFRRNPNDGQRFRVVRRKL